MTIIEMLGQSGVLTLLGMGVVFGFLIILVIVISRMGRFFSINDVVQTHEVQGCAITCAPPGTGNSAQITAAISAAITEYRKEKLNV